MTNDSAKNFFYTNIKQRGDNLLYIGYESTTGTRIQKRIPYKPSLYMETPPGAQREQYTGIFDEKLSKKSFESITATKDFIKQYENIPNFKLFGSDRFPATYVADFWKNMEIPYVSSLIRTFYLDIETWSGEAFPKPENPKDKITVITIFDSKTKTHQVFCERGVDHSRFKDRFRFPVVVTETDSEKQLLEKFLHFWTSNYPDVVTGWYTRGFDIPYLIKRISYIVSERAAVSLSPWNQIQQKTGQSKRGGTFKEVTSYDIYGINELDYLDLYQKYVGAKKESYKLDFIAQEELGETKDKYEGSLHNLYETDYSGYVAYNIQDVELIVKLEEKLRFIELIIDVSYSGKVPTFNDSLGTIKYWEILISAYFHDQNKFSELKSFGDEVLSEQFAGGYVKDTQNGRHNWIVNFDFTSLYPSIIRQVNIGSETLLSHNEIPDELQQFSGVKFDVQDIINKNLDLTALKTHSLSLSCNGKFYRTNKKSFLSELMEKFFNKRLEYKRLQKQAIKDGNVELEKIYHIKQLATKILINAAYGAVGNRFFEFFCVDNAEAITLTGQAAIQFVEARVNEYLNRVLKTQTKKDFVVAIDTDSVAGESVIIVNNKKMKIEDYYNSIENNFIKKDEFNQNFVKIVDNGDIAMGFNTLSEKIVSNKIKYIMKHKVKKKMYEIKCNGSSVIVTEDHSIIIKNKKNGKFSSIKPSKLNPEIHFVINIIGNDTDCRITNENTEIFNKK